MLLQDLIEILSNFQLITQHFGDSILEQVSNTNFMVYLTNVYCLARKIKKIWLPDFKDCNKQAQYQVETCLDHVIKITITVQFDVLQRGLLNKIGQRTPNYSVVQSKIATTLKSYMMCIVGSQELAKDVLNKQVNYMCQTDLEKSEQKGLYSGKNYSIAFLKTLVKRGLTMKQSLREFDDIIMDDDEKQLLLIVLESIEQSDATAKI